MSARELWGLFNIRKDGFIKGHVYMTKGDAINAMSQITQRKRDPLTNHFRHSVIPREIPKDLYKKTMEQRS